MRSATVYLLTATALLSGCGSSSGTAASATSSAPGTHTSAPAPKAADAVFGSFVRQHSFATTEGDVAGMVDLAHSICAAYGREVAFADVVATVAKAGDYSAYEAGQINGAATAAYCPEYADRAHA